MGRGTFSKHPTTGICRDCGHVEPVKAFEFKRSVPPRCPACGGMLDRQGFAKQTYLVSADPARRTALQEHIATRRPAHFIKADGRRHKVYKGRHRWHKRRPRLLRAHKTCLGCGRSDAPLRLFHLHPGLPDREVSRANTIPLCVPCDTKLRHYLENLSAPQHHAPEVWVTLFSYDLNSARKVTKWLDRPRQRKGSCHKRGQKGPAIPAAANG